MKIIRLPALTMSPTVQEHMSHQKIRPLNICGICRHVRCSCGGCHSRVCADPCGYESSGTAASTIDSDGKTWCAACGGNYLPHSH